MRLVLLIIFALLLACRNNQHSEVHKAVTDSTSAAGDTTKNTATSGSSDSPDKFDTVKYKIHTQKTLPGYTISLWQCALEVNAVCPPFLLIRSTRTHKVDTLPLTHISDLQDRSANIDDITKPAGFPQLTLMISWEGESDNTYSEVVGYEQDTLKELFAIPNAGGMSDTLRRKDKWTLVGHVFDRDDIVATSHDNYLIRVSLKDYSVKILTPDTVDINYDTKAKESIHAYRLLTSGKKIPYTILPGTHLHIDTFFYKQQVVRLHLDDSIRLSVPHDEIQFKVNGETAG